MKLDVKKYENYLVWPALAAGLFFAYKFLKKKFDSENATDDTNSSVTYTSNVGMPAVYSSYGSSGYSGLSSGSNSVYDNTKAAGETVTQNNPTQADTTNPNNANTTTAQPRYVVDSSKFWEVVAENNGYRGDFENQQEIQSWMAAKFGKDGTKSIYTSGNYTGTYYI